MKDEDNSFSIIKYRYENNNFKKICEKKNASNCWIYVSIELNNGIIASGGEDKLIKLWKD